MENTFVYTSDFIHPVKETWGKHKKWIIFLLLIKGFIIFSAGDITQMTSAVLQGNWREQADRMLMVNNDELLIAEVAINQINGLGFVSSNEIKRKKYPYDFTAFRPSYPVYLHIGLMQLYRSVFPDQRIVMDKTAHYFRLYAAMLLTISFLFFAMSLFYFSAIASVYLNKKLTLAALFAYGLYPPVLLYVGSFANYESITMSMVILIFYFLLKAFRHRLRFAEGAVLIILTLLSSLFRPQVNFIFLFVFGVWFMNLLYERKVNREAFRQALVLCVTIPLLLITLNIPVLIKNHRLFGAYILTTTGINISFGHNPFARGSWCGTCMSDPQNPYYSYIRNEIRNYDALNEYEKSHELEKLSYKWIRENPMAEMKLAVRKMAIFFLPENSDSNRFNLFNLFVHAGAVLYCLRLLFLTLRGKLPAWHEWMLLAPLAGAITMCIVFHVGYRWRYFADPFMVLCAMAFMQLWIRKWFPSMRDAGIQPTAVD